MTATVILLIVIGLVLLGLEVYVPGMILGSVGVALLLVAAGLAYANFPFQVFLLVVGLEFIGALATVILSLKVFPETRVGRKMILAATQTNQRASQPRSAKLVGCTGIAHTVLRPAGVALVDGQRLDVVAESGMIEVGSSIKVVSIDGGRIVVRKT